MTKRPEYRPENPLPRTPDNHRHTVKAQPVNRGRRFVAGQREHGDAKARAEQKAMTDRDAMLARFARSDIDSTTAGERRDSH